MAYERGNFFDVTNQKGMSHGLPQFDQVNPEIIVHTHHHYIIVNTDPQLGIHTQQMSTVLSDIK